jgi:hypothetical protein
MSCDAELVCMAPWRNLSGYVAPAPSIMGHSTPLKRAGQAESSRLGSFLVSAGRVIVPLHRRPTPLAHRRAVRESRSCTKAAGWHALRYSEGRAKPLAHHPRANSLNMLPHPAFFDVALAGLAINDSHAGQGILRSCLLQEARSMALRHARRSTSGRATRPNDQFT